MYICEGESNDWLEHLFPEMTEGFPYFLMKSEKVKKKVSSLCFNVVLFVINHYLKCSVSKRTCKCIV